MFLAHKNEAYPNFTKLCRRVQNEKGFVISNIHDLGKFDSKSDEGIFIGYSLTSKAYRIYNKRTNLVEESIHVSFDESNPCATKDVVANDDLEITNEIHDLTIQEKDDGDTQVESTQIKEVDVINQPQDAMGDNQNLPKDWRFVQNHPKDLILGEVSKGQTNEGILINQAKYAKELIKKFGMEGSKPMSTPMSTSTKLDKDENGKAVNEKMYRGLFYPRGVAFDLVGYSDADFGGFKVDRKRKGKRRRSGAESSAPQPDYNTQLFSNRVNEGNWAGFKSRPIVSGRQVITSPRYYRYINDVITAAGWTEMMNVSNIYYPKLVRYFYCNLDVDRDADEYTLVSRVKGVDLVLDVSTMSNFLKCPVVDNYQYVANEDELVNTIDDVAAFYQTITDDRVIGGGVSKTELKKHLRPLHLFIAHNVAPQKGHYDAVSPLHCLILHSLETRNYMDLSYLVLREMASVLQDNHKALPYGALLTKLFLDAKVNVTQEQSLPNDPGAIRDYVFTRGHIHDEDAPNPQVNVEQEQENIAGQQGTQMAQPQFVGDFSQQMFSRFDALQASQNQMLVEFQQFAIAQNSRFDRVEHRMDHIVQAQQHYFSHYHQQYPAFVPYPPYHPPSPPQ
ncbi:hypothetical protein RHSIM_Rhsim03G0198100 [Rhododendron simsii]|uniref:Uncharacterized protein n=1 Tax=Rhododendron simsii TaxID=118357 RepID=A0A834LUG0_RHOSS|nr:hypothetical protein RHSIM_Rhsim03G0198100 [Rhododendron simsii]